MDMLAATCAGLQARKGQWPAIAEATGLSYSWILKLAQGRLSNPGIRYVQRLHDYFERHPLPQVRSESA